MLLSGCSENDLSDPDDGQSYTVSSTSVGSSGEKSHAESSSAGSKQSHIESSSANSSQSHGESSSANSKQSHKASSKPVSQQVVEPAFGIDKKILEAAYSNMCLTVYSDGQLSGDNSQDFAENIQVIYNLQSMLSGDTYETSDYLKDIFPTKQDYVNALLSGFPELSEYFDENGKLTATLKPAMYIGFVSEEYSRYDEQKNSDPETEKLAFFRAAEWIVNKLGGGLPDSVRASIKENGYAFSSVSYSINDDGVIDVSAKIDLENDPTVIKDKFHISGKGGFVLGDSFITYDTEKLAISSRDSFTFSMLAGDFIPDDCKIVCPKSEYSEVQVDFAEIAEKLPNLKELYMYQSSGKNREAIADMKNLTSLSYYLLDDSKEFPTAFADCPFKNLKNLRSLRLYANYKDYSFLNEMSWLTDIHIDFSDINKDGSHKTLFYCPGITSLTISGSDLDLGGIEKLTKLKKLEISCEVLDFAPLGKLKNLEDLHVRCTYNSLNVSELAKAAKIKTLFLSSLKTKDWSFLKQMKNLTDLSLYYIPNIRNSDLAPLKQLKSLSLSESGCDVAAVGNFPNLEAYSEVMSYGGDFSVFMKCPRLRWLNLMGCRTGVMDFNYVQNCPLEVINCDGTEVTNVEQLANIKTLKSIFIATDEQNITCGDMLKKALPNCEVSVDQPSFFHNHL